MDSEEVKKLAKAKAEADEDLRLFLKMQAEYQPVEPLEVKPVPNHELTELEKISDDLKGLADDVSDYYSKADEYRRTDLVNAEKNKKQNFRHDFLVAAFGAAMGSIFTLLFQHFNDFMKFIFEFFSFLS